LERQVAWSVTNLGTLHIALAEAMTNDKAMGPYTKDFRKTFKKLCSAEPDQQAILANELARVIIVFMYSKDHLRTLVGPFT